MALVRTPLTEEQLKSARLSALLRGRRGEIEYDYEMWRSNVAGDLLEFIGTVEGAEIDLSNLRDHTWELNVDMREAEELDLFSDYVRIIVKVRDGETWREFPMGNYVFDAPSGADDAAFTSWGLTAKSAESILLADAAETGYPVNAGTGVLAAVRTILTTEFGIPASRIDFPPASLDVALGAKMFFSPFQDYESARWLRICNALLAAGGFYALYTDGEGRWKTKEIETLADNTEAVRYGNGGGDSYENLVIGPIEWNYSDESFENKTVVYASDANISPPVVGAAELHSVSVTAPNSYTAILVDPDSPFSIERYGRTVSREPETLQNIVSVTEARKIAKRKLKVSAGMNFSITVPTTPDPRRGPREVYRLYQEREDGALLYSGKWRVIGWRLPLDLSEMSHELSRNIEE